MSGWFLIHGHVCFLLFVPLLGLGAVAARLVPHLRRRAWPRPVRLVWLPVAVISAVFALPIAGELALHLHQERDRRRPPIQRLGARRRSVRYAGGVPASAGHSDRWPQVNVA